MQVEDLINGYPKLYHMAELGSWDNIQTFGLLSTSALLDLYGINGKQRVDIESTHRPGCISISKSGMADAVVRDQKPMDDKGLIRALKGSNLTPKDWYEILNRKTFFWTSKNRLHRLLNAKAYADFEHDVLTLDTRGLITAHANNVLLCPYNSGCTKPMPVPRDASIFKPIKDYDPLAWKTRKDWDRIVEVCVEGGVPDVQKYVLSVDRMKGESIIKNIYKSVIAQI